MPRNGALIIVDVQKDFLPGGALPVPGGEAVVPLLSRYAEKFRARGLPVFATRDWHPPGHCSFRERGGPWPVHCLAGTPGANFAEGLELPPGTVIVSKAVAPERDAYSGFQGTDLDRSLRGLGVGHVYVGGLATDYCVLNTVKDARALGYSIFLLDDAVRGVEARPGDSLRARDEMLALGAVPVRFDDV